MFVYGFHSSVLILHVCYVQTWETHREKRKDAGRSRGRRKLHADMRWKEVKRTESEDSGNKENRGERKYKAKHTKRLGKDE
jgi:hypothetical protein